MSYITAHYECDQCQARRNDDGFMLPSPWHTLTVPPQKHASWHFCCFGCLSKWVAREEGEKEGQS